MSPYIQILNALKKHISQLSLTHSQADCRISILERLNYPGIVNLYGSHGSGKTFLGWSLASEGHANYVIEPKQIAAMDGPASIFFVDNAGYRRSDYRAVLGDLERARVNKAVVVTLERIDDSVQAFQLCCTSEDIQIACANFAQIGYPPKTGQCADLWDLLQSISRRGL